MKKIYTTLLAITIAACAQAQMKVINLQATMLSPTNGQTITVNQPFNLQVEFKNLGPGTIVPGDSLFYTFTGAGTAFVRVATQNKAVNDTIYVNRSITFTQAPNGPLNFCALGYIFNGSTITDNDTTNNQSCRTVTITGGTNGIVNILYNNDEPANGILGIYPNPASTVVNFDFKAMNYGEVLANVYDLSGRKVMQYNFGKAFPGQSDFRLDVGSLNSGFYIVEIAQDGIKSVGRLNKQ